MLRVFHVASLSVALWTLAAAQPPDAPAVVQVPRPKVAPWTEIKTGVGQLTLLTAGEKPATWALVDDVDADLHATKDAAVVVFAASKTGRYRVVAFVEGSEPLRVVLVVGTVVPGPGPVDPGPVDPDPPPPMTGGLYFLVVRPDGPALPSFTKVMGDPAWETLSKAGHKFKDKTATEADAIGVKLPTGTTLPVVVTLRLSADGKSSTVVRGAVPLPTTGDAILKLPDVPK